MKKVWLIVSVILISVITGSIILWTYQNDNRISYVTQSSQEQIVLDINLPASPITAPAYKVIAKDSIFEDSPKSMEIKKNIPSETEAILLAEEVLKKYGGLPDDAVLSKVEQVAIKKYNLTSGIVEEQYPQWTQVIYEQNVRGMPVIGPGAEINIGLGENGEALFIEKAWRYLEYDNEVPVISAEQAFEKLKHGELLVTPQSSLIGLHITKIQLGYYAEQREQDQKSYTPVWIFYGTHEGSTNTQAFPYPVNAMK